MPGEPSCEIGLQNWNRWLIQCEPHEPERCCLEDVGMTGFESFKKWCKRSVSPWPDRTLTQHFLR